MFETNPPHPRIARRQTPVEQWRVPFPQRHHMTLILEKREHLAVTPHSALIERLIAHPPLAPSLLQRPGVASLALISDFEQTAALRAVVNHFRYRVFRSTSGLKAGQE